MDQKALDQLRASNRVVPVSSEDEGRSWSKISNGVFGFTYTPANSDGGLFAKQPRDSFEMHKLPDGTLLIIGFANADGAQRLTSAGAQELDLYPVPRGDFSTLVSVPHARLASSKALDRDDFNRMKLSLKPAK